MAESPDKRDSLEQLISQSQIDFFAQLEKHPHRHQREVNQHLESHRQALAETAAEQYPDIPETDREIALSQHITSLKQRLRETKQIAQKKDWPVIAYIPIIMAVCALFVAGYVYLFSSISEKEFKLESSTINLSGEDVTFTLKKTDDNQERLVQVKVPGMADIILYENSKVIATCKKDACSQKVAHPQGRYSYTFEARLKDGRLYRGETAYTNYGKEDEQ